MIQPIFRGGKTIAETKQAQSNIQAQRAQLADTEQNVLLAAVTSYADLVQNIGIADARRNNVRVLVQQLDATRERFRVGELTITDVSQSEARLELAKADLVQAETNVRIAEAAFQRTIGKKPGKLGEIPLIGGLPSSAKRRPIGLAMDAGPRAVTRRSHRITAATYGVNSAVGDLLPQVNLVGALQQQFDVQVPSDKYYNYIRPRSGDDPDLSRTAANGRASGRHKELVGQRRNELDSARRAVAENVIRAWRQLDSSRSRVTSFEAAGPRQRSRAERRAAGSAGRIAHHPRRVERRAGTAQCAGQPDPGTPRRAGVLLRRTLGGIGRLTARTLALPVEYYDEERYYKDVGSRWIGWGSSGESGTGITCRHPGRRRAGAPLPGAAVNERRQGRPKQRAVDGRHPGVHPQDHFRRRGPRAGCGSSAGRPWCPPVIVPPTMTSPSRTALERGRCLLAHRYRRRARNPMSRPSEPAADRSGRRRCRNRRPNRWQPRRSADGELVGSRRGGRRQFGLRAA